MSALFRSLRALAIASALLLLTVAPAAAIPTLNWRVAEQLTASNQPGLPARVALGGDGTAAAVWREDDATTSTVQVRASVRAAGGMTWEPPSDLDLTTADVSAVRVVVDDQGNATALWVDDLSGLLRYSVHPAGGSWSLPQGIPTAAPGSQGIDLGVDAAGTVTAAWTTHANLGTDPTLWQATLPRGGSWSTPAGVNVGGDPSALELKLAVASSGAAIVVWRALTSTPSVRHSALAATRTSAGVWGAPQELAGNPDTIADPAAAILDDGRAVAAWAEQLTVGGIKRFAARAALAAAGGSWGSAQTVSTDSASQHFNMAAAMTAAGDAVLAYQQLHTAGPIKDRVIVAAQPAGGTWLGEAVLSDPAFDAGAPAAAADPNGRIGLIWEQTDGVQPQVAGRFHEPDTAGWAASDWSLQQEFSRASTDAKPDLALNGGRAVAGWVDGATQRATAAFADAGPVVAAGNPAVFLNAEPVSAGDSNGTATHPAQTVMDGAGNITAIWATNTSGNARLWTAFRPAGGPWGTPELLAGPGFVDAPQLALDASGNATALWVFEEPIADHAEVQTAVRPAGGSWSAPQTLSCTQTDCYPNAPDLAVAADGAATATWRLDNGSDPKYAQVATRTPAGVWSAAETASAIGLEALTVHVAVAPDGTSLLAWEVAVPHGGSPLTYELRARKRAAGSTTWEPEFLIADEGDSGTPGASDVTAGGDNRFTVMWKDLDGSKQQVYTSTSAAGAASFGPATPHASPAHNTFDPVIERGADGSVLLAWLERDGVDQVYWSGLPQGGNWSVPQRLSDPLLTAASPVIAADRDGRVTVAWTIAAGLVSQVQAARIIGAAVTTSALLSPSDSRATRPRLAFDDAGNGVLLWTQESAPAQVLSCGIDVEAPALSGAGSVSVPSTATVGEPVSMTAAPFDVWGPLQSSAWDFGDGRSGTGGSVSHSYAAAGTYTVTVTATDAAGLTRSASRTITVAATPTPAPPAPPLLPGGPVVPPIVPTPPAEPARVAVRVDKKGKTLTLDVDLTRRKRSAGCPKVKQLKISITEQRKSGKKTKRKTLRELTKKRKLQLDREAKTCTLTGTIRLSRKVTDRKGRTLVVKLRHTRLKTKTLKLRLGTSSAKTA